MINIGELRRLRLQEVEVSVVRTPVRQVLGLGEPEPVELKRLGIVLGALHYGAYGSAGPVTNTYFGPV